MEWRGTFYLIGMEVSQGFSNLISNNLQQTNLYLHLITGKILIVNKRLLLLLLLFFTRINSRPKRKNGLTLKMIPLIHSCFGDLVMKHQLLVSSMAWKTIAHLIFLDSFVINMKVWHLDLSCNHCYLYCCFVIWVFHVNF